MLLIYGRILRIVGKKYFIKSYIGPIREFLSFTISNYIDFMNAKHALLLGKLNKPLNKNSKSNTETML